MEVSLAQVSCILMYVYVAPPTPVGAWSMALGLRQRFEYYYCCLIKITVQLYIITLHNVYTFTDNIQCLASKEEQDQRMNESAVTNIHLTRLHLLNHAH